MKKLLLALMICLWTSGVCWAGNIPLAYQLFGPAQGEGTYSAAYNQWWGGEWRFATGVSSTSKTFLFGSFGGMKKFHWVRGLVVWQPNGPWSCVAFVWWHAGAAKWEGVKPKFLGYFCGNDLPQHGEVGE